MVEGPKHPCSYGLFLLNLALVGGESFVFWIVKVSWVAWVEGRHGGEANLGDLGHECIGIVIVDEDRENAVDGVVEIEQPVGVNLDSTEVLSNLPDGKSVPGVEVNVLESLIVGWWR